MAPAIVVTTLGDSHINGQVTLREALDQASNQTGDVTIAYAPGLSGTTVLGSALSIDAPNGTITIDGSGAQITLSGNKNTEVFVIASDSSVALNDLTITNGNSNDSNGGAIFNDGTLAVSNCTLTTNTAGAADGGGIYSDGTLTVTNSTFANNSAGGGGGIFNDGALTVTNSTFANNSATHSGQGGGIYSDNTLAVSNSTFANNSAGDGGGIYNEGELTVLNGTFAANTGSFGGGGITNQDSATTQLTNTIVAANTNGKGQPTDINGSVDAANSFNNLIGDANSAGGLQNGVNNNLVGVSNPGLAALGNYGGPTQTIALLSGSPALGAGTATNAPSTDQRGLPRNGAIDIGAFQSQGYTVTAVSGSNQQATVGTAFASPLTVQITADDAGLSVSNIPITFTVSPASNGAGLPASSYTASTDSNGQVQLSVSANTFAGSYTVTASSGSGAATFDLTNTPAVVSQLVVANFPRTVTAGSTQSFTVTAEDSYGNVTPAYNGTVHFSSTDIQAGLPLDITLTNGSGTFQATLKTAGPQSLTATDTANKILTGSESNITVLPAATSHLVVAGFPTPVTAGSSHSFTVTAEDPYGNPTSDNVALVVTSSDGQAVLPTGAALTNGSGTFEATLEKAGQQSLTAAEAGNSTIAGTESGIQVNGTTAGMLSFSQQPGNAQTFLPFNPAVSVQVEDASGKPISSSVPITVSLVANSGNALLLGTTTVYAVHGLATFTDLTVSAPGTGYTLQVTSPGLTGAVSNSFTVTNPAAGIAVHGSELDIIATAGEDISLKPAGSRSDGSTGVQVRTQFRHDQQTRTFLGAFTTVRVVLLGGDDEVRFDPSLTLAALVDAAKGDNSIHTAAGNDVIWTANGFNTITTGKGNKTITVGNGGSFIHTDDGNDTVTAGNGCNVIELGNGNHIVKAGNGNNNVRTGNGIDTITLGRGNAIVQAGDGDKTITVSDGDNWIRAGTGNDTVMAGNGSNTIRLGNGDNVVVTGNGDDDISVGNGANLIAAGLGRHTVRAGNGSNILIDGSVTLTQANDSLRQVLADWKTYGPTPANVLSIRARLQVTDNSHHANTLDAGRGRDWFWYQFGGTHTNRKPTDLLN